MEYEEKHWHPLNKIDRLDRWYSRVSWVVGVLAGICFMLTAVHEVLLRWGR